MSLTGKKTLVCGGGGFIGGHMVKALRANGMDVVRAVDIKPLCDWHQITREVENLSLDLTEKSNCLRVTDGIDVILQLAADMGGMGFIERNRARCMSFVAPDALMLSAAVDKGVQRFFYSSSACVYNVDKQASSDVVPLKESDAFPAKPEAGYGEEKLYIEQMCRTVRKDFGLATRVARYHNVYGPHGTWTGGREKAPAAICRKVIEAKLNGVKHMDVWGDGKQTRSFMYIDDCTKGTQMLLESDFAEPLNLGSSELVTIDQLVDLVEEIAGVKLLRIYKPNAPKGVNGRNSDNTLINATLGWEPSIPLRQGLAHTYHWIEGQVLARAFARRYVLPPTPLTPPVSLTLPTSAG